jgi:hypothetical protein
MAFRYTVAHDMEYTVKQTAFRFTEEDLVMLEAIREHTGVRSRVDSLRVVIRHYVRCEGIQIGKPKTRTKR